jgi:hypothetical protein
MQCGVGNLSPKELRKFYLGIGPCGDLQIDFDQGSRSYLASADAASCMFPSCLLVIRSPSSPPFDYYSSSSICSPVSSTYTNGDSHDGGPVTYILHCRLYPTIVIIVVIAIQIRW